MKTILSTQQKRLCDRMTIEEGTSSLLLMKRAGQGVISSYPPKGRIAVFCGSGNNGGDGYVISDFLHLSGLDVTAFRITDRMSDDESYYFDRCVSDGVRILQFEESTQISGFDTIYDCIFGTGFHGDPEGIFAHAIRSINRSGAFVISVDINSGLDGKSGRASLAVHSDLTVAIQNYQSGHFLCDAKDLMKSRKCVDIGIKSLETDVHLLEFGDLESVFQKRKNNSSKADFGYVCIIAGSLMYSGAAKLANLAQSAMRCGSGVVQLAVPRSIMLGVMPYVLESTLYGLSDDGMSLVFVREEFEKLLRFRTICFGMGLMNTQETQKALSFLLENHTGKLIIDADGLNALSSMEDEHLRNRKCDVILTPHLTEFSRLTCLTKNEILSDPVSYARAFASRYGITVLLKGPSTVVADKDRVYMTDRGCAGMATAGSGDVLSGIITALVASSQKDDAFTVCCAAMINGIAGERAQRKTGPVSMISSDTVSELKDVIRDCCSV